MLENILRLKIFYFKTNKAFVSFRFCIAHVTTTHFDFWHHNDWPKSKATFYFRLHYLVNANVV